MLKYIVVIFIHRLVNIIYIIMYIIIYYISLILELDGMFTIKYSDFVDCSFFDDYTIRYMPGIKLNQMDDAMVVLNTTEKSAYVYSK